MKKTLKVLIGIIIIIVLIWGVIFLIDYNRCANLKEPIFIIRKSNNLYYGLGYKVLVKPHQIEMYINDKFIVGAIEDVAETTNENTVIIKEGKIQNESLIDEFIENAGKENEVELIIKQDKDIIKLKYIPGEVSSYNLPNIPYNEVKDDSVEEYIRVYGEYILTVNDEETRNLDAIRFAVSRRNEENNVYLTFEPRQIISMICLAEPMDICKYSLDSSNYKQDFEISYYQRKDLGIKKIYEGEYNIYTYGGDVDIVIDKDMVYKLEDALDKGVIAPDDIVKQAQIDKKYGFCEERYYKDGGSIEYAYYKGFTVLKYNTLEGNSDLVIGMNGQIINSVNEILYDK